jgi:hypothetical protein
MCARLYGRLYGRGALNQFISEVSGTSTPS